MGEVPVPRIETDEDSEKLLASLLCAVRVGSETNSGADFRAHHETCDWCRAYVVQYREAKKLALAEMLFICRTTRTKKTISDGSCIDF